MIFRRHIAVLFRVLVIGLIPVIFNGCKGKQEQTAVPVRDYAVVAIEGDVDSFNPLFAQDVTAGEINDLFFPGLVDSRFEK